jgi:hypothetical protein
VRGHKMAEEQVAFSVGLHGSTYACGLTQAHMLCTGPKAALYF